MIKLAKLNKWLVAFIGLAIVQTIFWTFADEFSKPKISKSLMKPMAVKDISIADYPFVDYPQIIDATKLGLTLKPKTLPLVTSEAIRNSCIINTTKPASIIEFSREIDLNQSNALYVTFASDNFVAYANGALLAKHEGKFDAKPSRDGRRPHLFQLPKPLLKDGANKFTLIVRHNGCLPMVTSIFVGPSAILNKVYDDAIFNRVIMTWFATILALVVGVASLMLLSLKREARLIISFSLAMFAMAFRSYYSIWNDWRFEQSAYALIGAYSVIFNGATLAWFVYVLSGEKNRIEETGIALVSAAHLFVATASHFLGKIAVLSYVDTWFAVIVAIYLLIRILAWYRKDSDNALWILLIFSVFIVSILMQQFFSIMLIPMTFNVKHLVPIILVMALGAFMIYRGNRLYQEAEAARLGLEIKVAEKEHEIRESYLKLREQEKLNTLYEERQRLVHDMHDGIGGQLMSLLMLVRSPKNRGDNLPSMVQAIIDDLRLIIDSMDSVGDDLAVAIDVFYHRMKQRMSSFDIDLQFKREGDIGETRFSAQEVLNVYRFLQEACTNIIKHSKAKNAKILLNKTDDNSINLKVCDDGIGMNQDTKIKSRGLTGMRRRAEALGGELVVTHIEGTCVELHFPTKN